MSLKDDLIARALQNRAIRLWTTRKKPDLTFGLPKDPPPIALDIPTGEGSVRCWVYQPPHDAVSGTEQPPVLVNLHGGGYVMRFPEQDDHLCRYLATHAGCVVVNVDYDVAPQHRFPVPVTQAYDVCAWIAENGATYGWDGDRLAVGGQSAGGALAAAVARIARDERTFSLQLQVLSYPPLDLAIDPALKTSSIPRPMISPFIAQVFNNAYVPEHAERADPRASPALAKDLDGLAPALVITAEHDSLRAEGDRYAEALAMAGVPVTHRVIADVDHAFTHTGPANAAREAFDLIAAQLRTAFRGR